MVLVRHLRSPSLVGLIAAVALWSAIPGLARAGSFLPSYTGPSSEALDLTAIGATFDGSAFDLSSTSAAAVATAPTGTLFVWGIDRGAGTARFNTSPVTTTNPDIGANVLFDAVLLINAATGTATINLFNGTVETVPTTDITIAGNSINAVISAALLPSTGFAPGAYSFDLWPRVGAGQNDQIAQFFGTTNTIDPTNLVATDVPEPGPLWLLATGAVMLAGARRLTRRRGSTVSSVQPIGA